MQKRKLGKCGREASLLGFGCMRLPTVEGSAEGRKFGDIDETKAIPMIRQAIADGVDYVDTAYPYHGGKSELLVGEALQNGYRDKVTLATKLPVWAVKTSEDFERIFSEQLEKLQTESIDVYLVHALSKDRWEEMKELGLFKFLDGLRADGRAGCIGFSFHDELPVFKEIVDGYDWDVCQIQLNFMDENSQAGMEGLHYAAERGLGVIIMEPLRGGKLVKNVPPEVQAIWEQAAVKRSAAEWALRWLADMKEVSVILSGMGSPEEVEENMAVLDQATPGCLTDDERVLVTQAKNFYLDRTKVNCTDCKYCMPCPVGVEIPRIFSIYNDASIYNNMEEAKSHYKHIGESGNASQCIECGQCEAVCPQNLTIIQYLKDAHAALS